MKVDLHVHTYHSKDSISRPDALLHWIERREMDVVAITDHNSIDGALELAEIAPEKIIVGEEILTTHGEIIGLFLRERIAPYLSPQETVARIHWQDGLVYIPHPFDHLRGSTLTYEALREVLPQVDCLETFNARIAFGNLNRRAVELARERGIAMGAGSDAHRPREIGRGYVEMPPFDDAESFMESIALGQVHGRIFLPWIHLGSGYARLVKWLHRYQGRNK